MEHQCTKWSSCEGARFNPAMQTTPKIYVFGSKRRRPSSAARLSPVGTPVKQSPNHLATSPSSSLLITPAATGAPSQQAHGPGARRSPLGGSRAVGTPPRLLAPPLSPISLAGLASPQSSALLLSPRSPRCPTLLPSAPGSPVSPVDPDQPGLVLTVERHVGGSTMSTRMASDERYDTMMAAIKDTVLRECPGVTIVENPTPDPSLLRKYRPPEAVSPRAGSQLKARAFLRSSASDPRLAAAEDTSGLRAGGTPTGLTEWSYRYTYPRLGSFEISLHFNPPQAPPPHEGGSALWAWGSGSVDDSGVDWQGGGGQGFDESSVSVLRPAQWNKNNSSADRIGSGFSSVPPTLLHSKIETKQWPVPDEIVQGIRRTVPSSLLHEMAAADPVAKAKGRAALRIQSFQRGNRDRASADVPRNLAARRIQKVVKGNQARKGFVRLLVRMKQLGLQAVEEARRLGLRKQRRCKASGPWARRRPGWWAVGPWALDFRFAPAVAWSDNTWCKPHTDLRLHAAARGHSADWRSVGGDDNIPEMLRLMDREGLWVGQRDFMGRTPLHEASQVDRPSAIALLLECGADPLLVDTRGQTALHYAAEKGHLAACKALVAFCPLHAVTELLSKRDSVCLSTPFHLAAYRNRRAVCDLLRPLTVLDMPDAHGHTVASLSVDASRRKWLLGFAASSSSQLVRLSSRLSSSGRYSSKTTSTPSSNSQSERTGNDLLPDTHPKPSSTSKPAAAAAAFVFFGDPAEQCGAFGWNMLHQACSRVDVKAVRTLLESQESSEFQPGPAGGSGGEGYTSPSRWLLTARDHRGSTPAHLLCQTLSPETAPRVLRILHYLNLAAAGADEWVSCRRRACSQVVDAYPALADVLQEEVRRAEAQVQLASKRPDKEEDFPPVLLPSGQVVVVPLPPFSLMGAMPTQRAIAQRVLDSAHLKVQQEVGRMAAAKAELLRLDGEEGSGSSRTRSLSCPPSCPPSLRNNLQAARDNQGRSPLRVAMEARAWRSVRPEDKVSLINLLSELSNESPGALGGEADEEQQEMSSSSSTFFLLDDSVLLMAPIHIVCREGDLLAVKALVDQAAPTSGAVHALLNLVQRDPLTGSVGPSPLDCAVFGRGPGRFDPNDQWRKQLIQFMMSRGAEGHGIDDSGSFGRRVEEEPVYTCLLAVLKQDSNCLQALLDGPEIVVARGDRGGSSPSSSSSGNIHLRDRTLLDRPFDLSARREFFASSVWFMSGSGTLLSVAVLNRDAKMVTTLLRAGASIQDMALPSPLHFMALTPLIAASILGDSAVVEALLPYCDVNEIKSCRHRNMDALSDLLVGPLIVAGGGVEEGKEDGISQAEREVGTDGGVEEGKEDGIRGGEAGSSESGEEGVGGSTSLLRITALLCAARYGQTEVVRLLKAAGGDYSKQRLRFSRHFECSALGAAAAAGHSEIVNLLNEAATQWEDHSWLHVEAGGRRPLEKPGAGMYTFQPRTVGYDADTEPPCMDDLLNITSPPPRPIHLPPFAMAIVSAFCCGGNVVVDHRCSLIGLVPDSSLAFRNSNNGKPDSYTGDERFFGRLSWQRHCDMDPFTQLLTRGPFSERSCPVADELVHLNPLPRGPTLVHHLESIALEQMAIEASTFQIGHHSLLLLALLSGMHSLFRAIMTHPLGFERLCPTFLPSLYPDGRAGSAPPCPAMAYLLAAAGTLVCRHNDAQLLHAFAAHLRFPQDISLFIGNNQAAALSQGATACNPRFRNAPHWSVATTIAVNGSIDAALAIASMNRFIVPMPEEEASPADGADEADTAASPEQKKKERRKKRKKKKQQSLADFGHKHAERKRSQGLHDTRMLPVAELDFESDSYRPQKQLCGENLSPSDIRVKKLDIESFVDGAQVLVETDVEANSMMLKKYRPSSLTVNAMDQRTGDLIFVPGIENFVRRGVVKLVRSDVPEEGEEEEEDEDVIAEGGSVEAGQATKKEALDEEMLGDTCVDWVVVKGSVPRGWTSLGSHVLPCMKWDRLQATRFRQSAYVRVQRRYDESDFSPLPDMRTKDKLSFDERYPEAVVEPVPFPRPSLLNRLQGCTGPITTSAALPRNARPPRSRAREVSMSLHCAAEYGHRYGSFDWVDCRMYAVHQVVSAGSPRFSSLRRGLADLTALQKGAQYRQWTVLHQAAFGGHFDTVKQLLEQHNADKNVTCAIPSLKRSPLYAAVVGGFENIVEVFLDKGCDVNLGAGCCFPLNAAVCGGNNDLVVRLLNAGADPNLITPTDGSHHLGPCQTPLMEAAGRGHLKLVEHLLGFGAHVFHPSMETAESNLFFPLPLSDDERAAGESTAAELEALDIRREQLEEEAHDLQVLQQQMHDQAEQVRARLQQMLTDAADDLEQEDVDALQKDLEVSTQQASVADQGIIDMLAQHADKLEEILSQLRRHSQKSRSRMSICSPITAVLGSCCYANGSFPYSSKKAGTYEEYTKVQSEKQRFLCTSDVTLSPQQWSDRHGDRAAILATLLRAAAEQASKSPLLLPFVGDHFMTDWRSCSPSRRAAATSLHGVPLQPSLMAEAFWKRHWGGNESRRGHVLMSYAAAKQGLYDVAAQIIAITPERVSPAYLAETLEVAVEQDHAHLLATCLNQMDERLSRAECNSLFATAASKGKLKAMRMLFWEDWFGLGIARPDIDVTGALHKAITSQQTDTALAIISGQFGAFTPGRYWLGTPIIQGALTKHNLFALAARFSGTTLIEALCEAYNSSEAADWPTEYGPNEAMIIAAAEANRPANVLLACDAAGEDALVRMSEDLTSAFTDSKPSQAALIDYACRFGWMDMAMNWPREVLISKASPAFKFRVGLSYGNAKATPSLVYPAHAVAHLMGHAEVADAVSRMANSEQPEALVQSSLDLMYSSSAAGVQALQRDQTPVFTDHSPVKRFLPPNCFQELQQETAFFDLEERAAPAKKVRPLSVCKPFSLSTGFVGKSWSGPGVSFSKATRDTSTSWKVISSSARSALKEQQRQISFDAPSFLDFAASSITRRNGRRNAGSISGGMMSLYNSTEQDVAVQFLQQYVRLHTREQIEPAPPVSTSTEQLTEMLYVVVKGGCGKVLTLILGTAQAKLVGLVALVSADMLAHAYGFGHKDLSVQLRQVLISLGRLQEMESADYGGVVVSDWEVKKTVFGEVSTGTFFLGNGRWRATTDDAVSVIQVAVRHRFKHADMAEVIRKRGQELDKKAAEPTHRIACGSATLQDPASTADELGDAEAMVAQAQAVIATLAAEKVRLTTGVFGNGWDDSTECEPFFGSSLPALELLNLGKKTGPAMWECAPMEGGVGPAGALLGWGAFRVRPAMVPGHSWVLLEFQHLSNVIVGFASSAVNLSDPASDPNTAAHTITVALDTGGLAVGSELVSGWPSIQGKQVKRDLKDETNNKTDTNSEDHPESLHKPAESTVILAGVKSLDNHAPVTVWLHQTADGSPELVLGSGVTIALLPPGSQLSSDVQLHAFVALNSGREEVPCVSSRLVLPEDLYDDADPFEVDDDSGFFQLGGFAPSPEWGGSLQPRLDPHAPVTPPGDVGVPELPSHEEVSVLDDWTTPDLDQSFVENAESSPHRRSKIAAIRQRMEDHQPAIQDVEDAYRKRIQAAKLRAQSSRDSEYSADD